MLAASGCAEKWVNKWNKSLNYCQLLNVGLQQRRVSADSIRVQHSSRYSSESIFIIDIQLLRDFGETEPSLGHGTWGMWLRFAMRT